MYRFILAAVLAATIFSQFSSPVKADGLDGLLSDLDSALADTVSLDGDVVYLDFWASWCVPCRKSFPCMTDLQNSYREKGLRVIAVNLDRKRESADKFLREFDSPISIIFDPGGAFAKRLNLEVMPTSFIFGQNGELLRTNLGFTPEDARETEHFIRSLLMSEEGK